MRRITGRVEYEARGPNAALNDWAAPTLRIAQGFLLLSYRGTQAIDATTSSLGNTMGGQFSIRVPNTLNSDDRVVIAALSTRPDGSVRYAVVDPGFESSLEARSTRAVAPNPYVWSWAFSPVGRPDGDVYRITAAAGGGAARVFDYARYVIGSSEDHYATDAAPLAIWLGQGVEWSCGACQAPWSTNVRGIAFTQQVWIDGGTRTEGYWSDAVTAHELGHYVMASRGQSPYEGGQHFAAQPTQPGQAWSEGWATFYSSVVRNDTRYFDKQDPRGTVTFFWFDISARRYGSAAAWQRPSASRGLFQLIDENEVAAMLWRLRSSVVSMPYELGPFYAALSSPRATIAPFARGYRRRTWEDPEMPSEYAEHESAPMFADFLDALLCSSSVTSSQVDAVTNPSVNYPYPSRSPLCR